MVTSLFSGVVAKSPQGLYVRESDGSSSQPIPQDIIDSWQQAGRPLTPGMEVSGDYHAMSDRIMCLHNLNAL